MVISYLDKTHPVRVETNLPVCVYSPRGQEYFRSEAIMNSLLPSSSSPKLLIQTGTFSIKVKVSNENSRSSPISHWTCEFNLTRVRRVTGLLVMFMIGIISLARPLYAQSYAFNRLHVALGINGGGYLTAAAGDFNQDGKLDLAFASDAQRGI